MNKLKLMIGVVLLSLTLNSCGYKCIKESSTSNTVTTIVEHKIKPTIVKDSVILRYDERNMIRPIKLEITHGVGVVGTVTIDKDNLLVATIENVDTIYVDRIVNTETIKEEIIVKERKVIPKWTWYTIPLSLLFLFFIVIKLARVINPIP